MKILLLAVVVALPLVARAAPPVVQDADGVIELEPTEVDTVTCTFSGRTLTDKGTATAALRKKTAADASPSSVITAHTSSGSTVSITLNPDNGCGTSGCRAGNTYQIVLQPVEGSNKPICNLYLIVRRKYLMN